MTKAELYQKACMLPLLPGVYIIRDKSGTIIYIGKAKRLRIRVSQYFREGVPHDNKVSQMIAHAYAFDVIVCQSEFEALVLEASQIKAHTPKYNILLKDDKGYSYIKVTKDEWPRLSFTLQKEDDGAEYIGPYTSSFAARQMAETAMDAFLLPRCSRRFPQEIGRGRPCLNAHIGKCMAVCSGKISRENYEQAVKSAVHLIRYGKKDILKTLNERMLEASDRLEFETAALIRDQIAAITKVTAGQKVVVDPDVEMDVVALAGTPGSVCAAVLRFREGRLTDKREFLFHDTADIAAVREEFLPRYYLDDEQIPKVIAVDELPPDVDALQQALNEKRGSEVQLYVPQRGDKAHLVEMAHTNAVERLARESGRYAREEKLLDELAQVLGLPKPPRTIESYDISNWGDGTSVCGMVTFRDGKPYKAGYRKFKMKTVAGTDDYASLAETVSRRAAEYEKYSEMAANGEPSSNYFGQKPDLLLMDGGRGQVSAAKAALAGTALGGYTPLRHGEGRPPPHPRHRGQRGPGDHHQHEPRDVHLRHRHSGRDAPLRQRLPQAADEAEELFVHPHRGAGRRPQDGQGPDGTVQERGCRQRGHPRPAGEHPRRRTADGPDHLRIFPPAGVKQVEKSGADQSAAGLFGRSFYVPVPIRHQAGPLPALQGQRISGHRDGPPQRDRRGDGGLPSPVRRGRALGAPGGYVGRRGGAGRQASAALCLHWRNIRACARRPNAIQWVLQNKRACETV